MNFLSTIQRYLILGLVVLAAAGLAFGFYQKHQRLKTDLDLVQANADLTTERSNNATLTRNLALSESTRMAAEAALAERQIRINELESIRNRQHAELRNILQSNPDWADEPLPPGVRDLFTETR